MKIAIQGTTGSFHEEAADHLVPSSLKSIIPCNTFDDVFAAVSTGSADRGVVAIENSIFGSINTMYRLFNRYDVWIEGEVTLHIDQFLIATQPISLTDLQKEPCTVLSQAPALAQCELWLTRHLPNAVRQETSDTAASVQAITEQQKPTLLAVAGKRAASLYGGHIVAGPINDDQHNYTRFVLLGRTQTITDDASRTSIILTTGHAPGALVRALNVFAQHKINLSKLDSHPIPNDTRHYQFYIDLDAGLQTDNLRSALRNLERQDCDVKILGSYRH